MYYILYAFLGGALAGWLVSLTHVRSLKLQIEVYEYYIYNRIGSEMQRSLGLEVSDSLLPDN
ncbi:MAG TPA: hypothetical protein VG204_07145 [Terriglobia bacterium]|nr:hypothetical protein [Terriglobia bacterium]